MAGEAPFTQDRIPLADDELRRILERAARLDAERVTGVTAEDLRQIAIETGISAESIALALREAEAGMLPDTQAKQSLPAHAVEPTQQADTFMGRLMRRVPGWVRTTTIAWGSAIVGAISGVFINGVGNGEVVAVASLVALVWTGLELAAFHRKRGAFLSFERDLLALLLPFATVGTLFLGRGGEDFFLVVALAWFVLAILGGLITGIRWRWKDDPVKAD